jgi:hypothetical protein
VALAWVFALAVVATAPASPMYWGAWIGTQFTGQHAPWDMNAVSQFEALTGKPVSLVHFGAPFANCSSACTYYGFDAGAMEKVRSHGAIPFFSWSSQSTPTSLNEPDFQLSDVIAGRHDAFIRSFATAARNWGHPFFLRFNWEMNGAWFPWSEKANGNQPGEYVAAWRHVHDIFESVGASNATWTWCPNVDFDDNLQDLASLYPGDAYVDWSCLDGYNWATEPVKASRWMTFDEIYARTYDEIVNTIAPGKPMVIGEVASTENGGSKAAWITDALARVPAAYPRIRALLWFERNADQVAWPIESSDSSTAAFAAGIAAGAYRTNTFANLPFGPVQPPEDALTPASGSAGDNGGPAGQAGAGTVTAAEIRQRASCRRRYPLSPRRGRAGRSRTRPRSAARSRVHRRALRASRRSRVRHQRARCRSLLREQARALQSR